MTLKCCQAGAQHAAPLQGEGALARIGGFLAVDVLVFDVALGVGVDGHVSDDDGGGVNVGGCGDFGPLAAIGSNVWLSTQSCAAARREAEGRVLVNCNTPLPPGFSQVFILKIVKVLCFDTLLQVLILNDFQET